MNNHNIHASVWKVNVEALKRFLVCTVACTCVGVVYMQWTYIWMLRAEMVEITERFKPLDTAGKEGICCDSAVCFGVDDGDITVLSWALGQSRGEGLQVSGDTVTVEAEGPYFIYSQVLYKDTTWVMGHVITKRLKGAETKLMKCLKSMPSNVSQPLNTCYTAGIYFLESGSTLQLSVPRKSAELNLSAHATFMGLFRI
ncbi:tumor necrosis factor ligand superfamily member 13 isoform X5 [Pseudorasbora parva]|uniref:tumor necrosis factor ligand superfamily member 13 isoform X5 n=1 Tax=Pseudorasbora parva TaxID=51549 RepID=UPI00351E7454